MLNSENPKGTGFMETVEKAKLVGTARLSPLVRETEELIAVITAILVSSKRAA